MLVRRIEKLSLNAWVDTGVPSAAFVIVGRRETAGNNAALGAPGVGVAINPTVSPSLAKP